MLDTVGKHAKHLVPLYDQYNDANDRTAIMYLLDSLVPELANTMKKKHLKLESFAVVWMILLQMNQSTSVEVYELLKKLIKIASLHSPAVCRIELVQACRRLKR
jgi:hypothetical protein